MIIATTGSLQAGPNAPIVYRGRYEDIFPMMAEDGYHGVELHIRDSREIDRGILAEQLKQNYLTLTSIGTGAAYGAWHLNIADHDAAVRRRAIECLREHMITVSPYHGLVIIGSMQGRFRDAGSPEEFVGNVEESLYALDRLAEQYDVTIGYEIMNHYESDFLFNIKSGVHFMEGHSFKRIGLHIDTVHMNIDESDLGNAIREAGVWVKHVHIADNDRYYPGHGHMNFREILQGLKDIRYEGALALETFCRPESRICGRKSLTYLNFMMEEVYGKEEE
ncbi:sugar phosphate isomerase/epimerase family protein [Lacrimispora sp. 210928-DFI.3.58]|uniref:sugar phosphate isomerase/epimerase family protein n=1 Tax=Lacrimispora sp. 210928-DFI.3.58 TaxID=2883214 RepID=UPI001D074A95|nr:sugar phosphate isomerase/epimerase family protein [Lacrimispora sp. 210928-DFI.3.58]MCB7318014.1 sugar phosphate isomerase/epimerase [Lacrimispora sp. 210928-DFI.3.58]